MGNLLKPSFSLNCNGQLLNFNKVAVMGILNATPDSFYDGGQFNQLDLATEHVAKMIAEGADIIDVGGMSTRPNADLVSMQEEIDRVAPLIEKLTKVFPNIVISIDTYRSEVAQAAFTAGASILNDVSGGDLDENLFSFLAQRKCPYILTHIQGNPQTMQDNPTYEDVVLEVIKALSIKIEKLESLGLVDIIVDPGFGFGKTVEQNYQLLANLNLFDIVLKKPILAGLSRKSMLYKPLNIQAASSLQATTAANVLAIQNGASLLRVHDVKAAKEAIQITELYNQAQQAAI